MSTSNIKTENSKKISPIHRKMVS